MSATAVKANRRDMRRAMGESAVQMVEAHEQGLKLHAMSLRKHERGIEDVRAFAETVKADALAASNIATEPLRRDFLGRLRWLVTGA